MFLVAEMCDSELDKNAAARLWYLIEMTIENNVPIEGSRFQAETLPHKTHNS
jgi:hypothetical protein